MAAQAGLSTTTLFDPESGEELTPLGRLYGLVAMAAFLSLGGPLALVRALADSYAAIPAGQLGSPGGPRRSPSARWAARWSWRSGPPRHRRSP